MKTVGNAVCEQLSAVVLDCFFPISIGVNRHRFGWVLTYSGMPWQHQLQVNRALQAAETASIAKALGGKGTSLSECISLEQHL